MLLSIARLFALVGVYFKVPHLLTGAHQHVLCSFTCSIPVGNELRVDSAVGHCSYSCKLLEN